ncbi:alpha-N-acetylglucosaminidase [Oceaniferula spumae]|uniref:Alpha-N-acetylglucosaminidase n=1 Tax=Oceaniferula spumae TaxID=2979115 RepID=A0AAT9FHP2_9BACT
MIRNLLALFLLSAHPLLAASPEDTAAAGIIERMVPGHADRFVVDTSAPKVDGKDNFTISDTADGKIHLRGNNGVSVASAFNWYLKNRANCHVSWCDDQLNLPATLPKVGEPVTVSTPLKYRVYLNYCTLSYTAAWWDWERWQREIDFMAMNGVNMPLSVVGLEAAWYETMLKLGFTDEQARAALSGPSFAAWQWMCNLEGHGGPLPKSWIDKSAVLGKKITESQRALGMTPIQQGFSGVVPRLTQQKFPDAKITQGHSWCGFEGVAQLDPLDPLFLKIGSTLLAEQQRLFGTSHLYGCDPFHEGRPPSSKPEYLKKVGEAVHKLITSHDPKGRIVMQSWSIREAIATAIPKEHMLILDLKGTKHPKTDNFWGFEFVTGRLHNFGNRIKLHGDLTRFSKAPFATMADTIPNCVGGGLFMEGIMHNPVYFEIAFDNFWATESMPIEAWLNDYARRRYGADSESARKAWAALLAGPYKPGTDGQETSSMVCARPAITPKKSGPNNGFSFPYPKPLLLGAWEDLLKDADLLKSSDAYLYDLADVGRQVLSNHAHTIQPKVREAWEKRDLAAFDQATKEFEQLLLDIDTLVATRSEFSFAKWVDDARSHGTTEEEKNLFEKDARGLVTIWGPFDESNGKVRIFDYSWREWSGLIRSFYLPRWQKHHAMLRSHLVAGTEYSEEGLPKEYGREAFRANDFYDKLADWEMQWVKTPAPYGDPTPKGDPIAISQKLIAKYAQQIRGEAHGIPSGVEIKDIGNWTPKTFETRFKTISIPVTESLDGDGTYHVTFIYKSGRARLNITKVELLANGTLVNEDAHQGFAGNKHTDNTYKLELPEHAFGTQYEIRITAKTDRSTDSNGRITLHK